MEQAGKKVKPTSVYILAPAPLGISPGQRFRFEHYLPWLKENNINIHISSFLKQAGWKVLYTRGNSARKTWYVLGGFIKRVADLFKLGKYSFVFIYREAAPLGPPVFEWIIAKILRKKIIYDFDDAIWIPAVSEYNKKAFWLKSFGKVAKICRWSYRVSVGNHYLEQFAKKKNPNVVVVPTVVDTRTIHNKLQDQQAGKPAIGWTGTFSTLTYMDIVFPVLKELQETHDFTFIVIADKDPQLPLKNYRFIRWNKDTEAEDLLHFHIGLMPLYDDELSKGKCGFKAIQYMSLGMATVVSPVGVNSLIVDDGINGYVCNGPREWKEKLELLLNDPAARSEMGKRARQKIEEQYSVEATKHLFKDLFV